MKTTIKDVAKNAGVSISTVSRVLNNSAFVDELTKQRVILSAQELHYTPNQAARSLTRSETKTIGLILPGLFGEYFSEVLRGMDRIASAEDFDIMISGSKSIGTKFEKSIRAMSGRVDGLIIMSPIIKSSLLREMIPVRMPAVLLNANEENSMFDTVNVNNSEGAFVSVNHLIRLGHKRIALISGVEESYDSQLRRAGYRKAMMSNGLGQFIIEVNGSFTRMSGRVAAEELMSLQERPTAIFAANDAMAIGAMDAVQERGLRIPDDLAMVGFDDIPMSQYSNPKLTTIRIALEQFGETAMRRILFAVREKGTLELQHTVLGFELVVRASSIGK